MSAQVAAAVLHLKELSPEERLLLLLIGDDADGCDACEFSVERMAGRCGPPASTVARTVQSFADTGIYTMKAAERSGWLRVQFHIGRDGKLPAIRLVGRRAAP